MFSPAGIKSCRSDPAETKKKTAVRISRLWKQLDQRSETVISFSWKEETKKNEESHRTPSKLKQRARKTANSP
jgi:hypothetical protein